MYICIAFFCIPQVLNGRSNVEESTTSVTTTGATSATTSTTTSTTTLRSAAHLERPLSSTDLLRLCFLNNLGCEFGLNEVDRSGERSSATTTVTTSTTRSTSTTTRFSRKAVKTGKDKGKKLSNLFATVELWFIKKKQNL